jgi:hypothetical protein
MPMTITELTFEVHDINRRLTAAIENLNVEVAKINTTLGFIKKCAAVMVPIFVAIFLTAVGTSYKIIWDAACLHSSVEVLKEDSKAQRAAVEVLKEDSKAQRVALERIERSLAQHQPAR